jgi:hypothetical protein
LRKIEFKPFLEKYSELKAGVGITFEKPDQIEPDRIDNLKNLIGSNLIGSTISKT